MVVVGVAADPRFPLEWREALTSATDPASAYVAERVLAPRLAERDARPLTENPIVKATVEGLVAQRDALAEALRWYAEGANYERTAEALPPPIMWDGGDRARTALASLEASPPASTEDGGEPHA
jgi:hypothetical protein